MVVTGGWDNARMPGEDKEVQVAQATVDPDELARVERLFETRPDLLDQRAESLAQLQNVAAWGVNLRHCVSHLNQFDLEVLETLTALKSRSIDELTADLDVSAGEIDESVQRLLDRWLVKHDGDRVRTANLEGLGNQHPAGLGLKIDELAAGVSPFAMKSILRMHSKEASNSKTENIAMLRSALTDAASLLHVVNEAPLDAKQMLHQLVTMSPRIRIEYGRTPNRSAIEWLTSRGLLFESNWNEYQIPREAGITLRNGRVVLETHPIPPLLVFGASAEESIDAHAAFEISKFVSKINHLLVLIENDPPRALSNDGMSVKDVKRLASALDVSEQHMSILLELVESAGLIARRAVAIFAGKKQRRYIEDNVRLISVTERAEEFEGWTLGAQWLHLVRAWMSAPIHLSDSGQKDVTGKLINTLSQPPWRPSPALCQRSALFGAFKELFPKQITSTSAYLADFMAWHAHQLFATDDNDVVIEQFIDEAELFCVFERGALTAAGYRFLSGEFDEVVAAINASAPATVDRFTIGPDATVMIGGTPSPSLLKKLLSFSDVESRDAAWIVRVSDASIRRALDGGATAEELVNFLDENSDRDLPQSVSYLFDDVARRHGNVVIGSADSFITTTDPVILSDIVRHKSLSKLGLQQVAPTVAVANADKQKLLTELRKAGFMPKFDDETTGFGSDLAELPHGSVSFESKHVNHSVAGSHVVAQRILENSTDSLDDPDLDVQGVLALFTAELRRLGIIDESVELHSSDIKHEGIQISAMALQATMDRTPLLYEAADDDGNYLDIALAEFEQGSITLHSLMTGEAVALDVKAISWMMTITSGPNREARLFND